MVNGFISLLRDFGAHTDPLFLGKQIWRSSAGFQKNRDSFARNKLSRTGTGEKEKAHPILDLCVSKDKKL